MGDKEKLLTQDGTGSPCMIYGNENTDSPNILKRIFDKLLRDDEEAWWPVRNALDGHGLGDMVNAPKSNTTASGKNAPKLNTYPDGDPSDIFPSLRVACYKDKSLKEVLDYIANDWGPKAGNKYGLGTNKHVLLVTDKWDPNIFKPYEEEFRRRAMHEDFWFFFVLDLGNGYHEIPFLPIDLYDFTRHPAS